MIRLDLSREPRWLDLGHGVRLRVASVAALRDAMSSAATKIDETAAATGRLDEAFEAVGGAGGSTGGDEASEAAGSAGRAAASGRQVGTALLRPSRR